MLHACIARVLAEAHVRLVDMAKRLHRGLDLYQCRPQEAADGCLGWVGAESWVAGQNDLVAPEARVQRLNNRDHAQDQVSNYRSVGGVRGDISGIRQCTLPTS